MSPNELTILRLVQELERVDKVTISRKMAISTDYADCLLKSLSRHGYLAPICLGESTRYALTETGGVALLNDLFQLQARLDTRIGRLTYERDRIRQKMEALLALREGATMEREESETAEPVVAQVGKT